MTYKQIIKEFSNSLYDNDDLLYLIREVSNLSYSELVFKMDDEIDPSIEQRIKELATKYISEQIPVQYLLGYAYFYGLKLKVNKNVLIPRRETEELVEKVIEYSKELSEPLVILDIGCGSGAIGLALKKELPNSAVYLSDISLDALEVAKENAKLLGLDVHFIHSDMLDEIKKMDIKFNIVVSNPPYIDKVSDVDPLVLNNEPHLALFSLDDGVYFYRRILESIDDITLNKAIIGFEHGYNEQGLLKELINNYLPKADIYPYKDLSGNDRIIICRKN